VDFDDLSTYLGMLGPAYLIAVAIPLSIIDVKQRRLPNNLVLPGVPVAFLGQLFGWFLGAPWQSLVYSIAWMFGGFAIAFMFNWLNALGMGDVKLISLICLNLGWFGWQWPLTALTVAFTTATLLVLLFFATGRYRLSSTIPLGPYLLTGFLAATIGLVVS